MTENEWSHRIIGACIAVHEALGPGLLESAYQACVAHELANRSIPFGKEVEVPVNYAGNLVDCGFRLDFVIDNKVVLELKAVEKVLPIHEAQVLTYLKLTGCKLGLLINFNVKLLKDDITRLVHNL